MSENTNMQEVLKEKQQNLVDAINNSESKSYKSKSKSKSKSGATNKSNNKDEQESSDDNYSTDDDYSSDECTTDDDYIDFESIINEQNNRIAALEARLSKVETPTDSSK